VSQETQIAWAAGFYEGEGSISLVGGRLALQIKNNDLEPLEHFRVATEAGKIYGPYSYRRGRMSRNPFWVWVAQGAAALAVTCSLAPMLSQRRLGQVLDALARLEVPVGSDFDVAYTWIREVRHRGRTF
jgi:hypothetical protein